MDLLTLILFVLGLGLLIAGAELLVRGAAGIAAVAGVSPLLVGLTVVAYGTSAPEMSVSVMSALDGRADLAFGNVVGSNIFNVLFILGLSALLAPLVVARQLVRLDVPLMIAVSALAWLLAGDGVVGRSEGLLLVAGLALYTVAQVWLARRDPKPASSDEAQPLKPLPWWQLALLVLVGLALLVLGSRWLVDGAVALARTLGLSELIIGLTIVAAGTSLPEVATSVLATLRGQRDIAVGNVVGSNIFNLLGVLGLSAVVAPDGVPVAPPALAFDVPVMLAVALACLPIFFTGHRIHRWEGWLFLLYYAAYTGFLVLDSTDHDLLPLYSALLGWFVLPLTVATLLVIVWRAWRAPVRS